MTESPIASTVTNPTARSAAADEGAEAARVYSHSRLSSFENCPKQFEFRYVLRIPAESEGIEAFVGKRVHEVLERLYMFTDRGQIPSLEKVIARYHAFFDEKYDGDRIRIVREGMPLDHYRELGERCLRYFYRRHYPFDPGDVGETLGLEQHVEFALDPEGRYRVQGIIDRISMSADGVVEIHDYKTGSRVPSQSTLDKDRQLALYQIGLSDQHPPDQVFRLVWHFVARGQIRASERTPEELEKLRADTIKRIDQIEATEEFRPKKSNLCGWCEYKAMCPAFASDAESTDELTAARARLGAAVTSPPD